MADEGPPPSIEPPTARGSSRVSGSLEPVSLESESTPPEAQSTEPFSVTPTGPALSEAPADVVPPLPTAVGGGDGSLPAEATWAGGSLPDDAPFALCLTHDVDRPYKGLRSVYYAVKERSPEHLRTMSCQENPYWQFPDIIALERDLGVRSAFYMLFEQHLLAERPVREWFSPVSWVQHLGRYDPTTPEFLAVYEELLAGGWEVGLHGSFHSGTDRERLAAEKSTLERVLEESIAGGRQHYLRLSVPESWRHHRDIGLTYDASFGSGTETGFQYGYRPIRPFDDDFLVFPLTIMEQALPNPARQPAAARDRCEELLFEAAANEAVMTVLWHPRCFNEREFPGHRSLYRWLVERAVELGAWVGTPGDLVEWFERTGDSRSADQVPEATISASYPPNGHAPDGDGRSADGVE